MENFREQRNLWKGSPVFPDKMFRTDYSKPILKPVSGFRGRFSVNGTNKIFTNNKGNSGKKFTSAEFFLPFTQTLNRPVCPCKWQRTLYLLLISKQQSREAKKPFRRPPLFVYFFTYEGKKVNFGQEQKASGSFRKNE